MDLWIVFTVLGVALVLFVRELLPIDVTALLILAVLVATGVLTPDEANVECCVLRSGSSGSHAWLVSPPWPQLP